MLPVAISVTIYHLNRKFPSILLSARCLL